MHLQSKISNLKWLRAAWWWLRQVSGDAAYENYLRSAQRGAGIPAGGGRERRTANERQVLEYPMGREAVPGGDAALSPEEFYLDAVRRRYSGVSRCC